MKLINYLRHSWLLFILVMAEGCRPLRPILNSADDTNSYCVTPEVFTRNLWPATDTAPELFRFIDTVDLPRLSARSWQLARGYGLESPLRRLGQVSYAVTSLTGSDYQDFVKRREAIVLQVVNASGDVLRVAEELQCEKQRADQAAVALQRLETKRTGNFTVASLLVGAASGTISATVKNSRLNLVLTVVTAAVSAGFGAVSIFVNPQLKYPIRSNLLADVWYKRPHPTLYPAGLWIVLNEVRAGRPNSNFPAPVQTICRRWAQYNQLTNSKPGKQAQQQALYFGAGGSYHVDDLRTRSDMLAQLEVAVRLVNQDLQKLLVEVSGIQPQ